MKNVSIASGELSSASDNENYQGLSPAQRDAIAVNKRSNYFSHLPGIAHIVYKIKARHIVRGVKSALKEVEMIEKGIKKPKSLDQLLNEL